MCKICQTIGINDFPAMQLILPKLNSDFVTCAQRTKNDPENQIFNFGNNFQLTQREAAVNELMKRYYKDIHTLKNSPKSQFQPGSIGIQKLPRVILSRIPKAVDTTNSVKLNKLVLQGVIEKNEILQEITEKNVIDGIDEYFAARPTKEDVFISYNQHLDNPQEKNRQEKDLLLVNLTRAYILNIESKSTLEDTKYKKKYTTSGKSKTIKSGHFQLGQTLKILKFKLEDKLEQEWSFIPLVYCGKIDHGYKKEFCSKINQLIITKEDNFVKKLTTILDQHTSRVNSSSYIKDFHLIISEILPERVAIGKDLIKFSHQCLRQVIHQKVAKNVEEEAGNVESICFWSDDQFDLVSSCKNQRRVLFDSAFSTGKTLLMMECAKQLLQDGDKVLFVITSNFPNESPTLLNLKLNGFFEGMGGDFKIIQCDFKEKGIVEDLITNHNEYHIFIDELTIEFSYGTVTNDSIIQWSHLANPAKHFWVIIAYGKGRSSFDIIKLKRYFHIPLLKFPLRNPKEVVELVKSVMSGLNSGVSNIFGGHCLSQLEVPNNLTKTIEPILVEAENFKDGFSKVFQVLEDEFFGNYTPALILFNSTDPKKEFNCQCYTKDISKTEILFTQLKNYINKIFHQKSRCRHPIQYFGIINEEEKHEVKNWVLKAKENDLITLNNMAYGFEHNLVVVFQSQDPQYFQINECMRSTAMLVVVKLPEKELKNFCFGKCRDIKISKISEIFPNVELDIISIILQNNNYNFETTISELLGHNLKLMNP